MEILAFDPGIINFAAWRGTRDSPCNNRIITHYWECFNLGHDKPEHDLICDKLDSTPWLRDPPSHIVIETQQPDNIKARIWAGILYGYYRGKGVNVIFSGSRAKPRAIEYIFNLYPDKCGEFMRPKRKSKNNPNPIKLTRAQQYLRNKKEAQSAVSALLQETDPELFAKYMSYEKRDDMADAYLYGYDTLVTKPPKVEKKIVVLE